MIGAASMKSSRRRSSTRARKVTGPNPARWRPQRRLRLSSKHQRAHVNVVDWSEGTGVEMPRRWAQGQKGSHNRTSRSSINDRRVPSLFSSSSRFHSAHFFIIVTAPQRVSDAMTCPCRDKHEQKGAGEVEERRARQAAAAARRRSEAAAPFEVFFSARTSTGPPCARDGGTRSTKSKVALRSLREELCK